MEAVVKSSSTKKEKQEWTIEKPKLENARRLRCIYFNPDDAEFRETIMNARKRLEIPMEASIFCKIRKTQRKAIDKSQERKKRSGQKKKARGTERQAKQSIFYIDCGEYLDFFYSPSFQHEFHDVE